MTSQQQADAALARWRNPLEEKSFFAVNDLDSATARLDELSKNVAGIPFLREELPRIAPNVNRLVEILTDLAATEFKEAAE